MKITSREQFQYALHAGHGSAQLYVKEHGIEEVADIVLDACLKDRSYDKQAEESREKWLVDLFFNTAHYPTFVQRIIAAFQKATDPEDYDMSQLYFLLCELAKRGDEEVLLFVKIWVDEQLKQHNLKNGYASEWLTVSGLDYLPAIAENLGSQIITEHGWWISTLEQLLPDQLSYQEAKLLLQVKAPENPLIQAYLEHDKKEIDEQAERECTRKIIPQQERIRTDYSLEQLLIDSQNNAVSKKFTRRRNTKIFGKFATPEELAIIQQHIEQATNTQQLINLFWAFNEAELPVLTPKIWQLVRSKNTGIRAAALTALANSEHPDVYAFALEQVKYPDFVLETVQLLKLFELNFQEGDENLILNSIKDFVSFKGRYPKDTAEYLGRILNDIAGAQENASTIPLLMWAYENLPCSICRSTSINLLKDLDALTPGIVQECLLDANPTTRELFQENHDQEKEK